MVLLFLLLNIITTATCTFIEIDPKVALKEVSIACDNCGYPKTDALKSLIVSYHLLQSKNDTVLVKNIPGGHYSEKLYVASTKRNGQETPLFFFKISKKTSSTQNLLKIQEGPIGQKLRGLSDVAKKNLPIVMWLTHVFIYKSKYGIKKTIEVTPSAQGKLVQDILDSQSLSLIKKTAHSLGKSLAAFHQLFMDYNDSDNPEQWQTVYHGDFSIKNTLFNSTTNTVYFIDNEGMNTGSLQCDITAILVSLVMFQYLKKNYFARWPLYLNYSLSFLRGYIESYPAEKRAHLALFIEKTLTDFLHKVFHEKFFKNTIITEKDFNEKDFKKTIFNYLHTF